MKRGFLDVGAQETNISSFPHFTCEQQRRNTQTIFSLCASRSEISCCGIGFVRISPAFAETLIVPVV
jgi:hypothetical protein